MRRISWSRLLPTGCATFIVIAAFTFLSFSILATDSDHSDLPYGLCGWPLMFDNDWNDPQESRRAMLFDASFAVALIVGTASFVWTRSPVVSRFRFSVNQLLATISFIATIHWILWLEFGDTAEPIVVGGDYVAHPIIGMAVFFTWLSILDLVQHVARTGRA